MISTCIQIWCTDNEDCKTRYNVASTNSKCCNHGLDAKKDCLDYKSWDMLTKREQENYYRRDKNGKIQMSRV